MEEVTQDKPSVVLLAELAPWSEVVATWHPWPPATSTTARQMDEADDTAFGPSRPFAPSQAINDKVAPTAFPASLGTRTDSLARSLAGR
jgi:hypothetical protein